MVLANEIHGNAPKKTGERVVGSVVRGNFNIVVGIVGARDETVQAFESAIDLGGSALGNGFEEQLGEAVTVPESSKTIISAELSRNDAWMKRESIDVSGLESSVEFASKENVG